MQGPDTDAQDQPPPFTQNSACNARPVHKKNSVRANVFRCCSNNGSEAPSHFEKLLFDQANPNSMTTLYKEMSFGTLTVTGQVTQWIRAANPYSFYTSGESGT